MAEKNAWRELLRKQQQRYPELRPADAYKLVYQALNGTEHMLSDLDEARQQLVGELAALGTPGVTFEEPLTESIAPRGAEVTVQRVHLRPFAAQELDVEKLLTAMVETSLVLPVRDAAPLAEVWPALLPVLVEDLKFPADEVEALAREVELGRYPPFHHSPAYRKAYAPHYRVVARRAWKRAFEEES
jgi:hypothetical protein